MAIGGPPDGMQRSFAGKVVLISGATSGIGRATALAFARRGAHVVAAGRDAARGDAVVRACAALGADARFVQADIAVPDQVRRMVAVTVAAYGRLDVAFNNAAFQEPKAGLLDQPDATYAQVFDTNVRAMFLAMKAEIEQMLRQGGDPGAIVNNASVSGVRNPNPGFALYSASKAAVISLTRSAAMEFAPRGIRINAVSPGRVVTPMMLASKVADMSVVAAGLPLRRMGEPEEVAEAVVWLASPASSFTVGHNLCVDGGFLAQ